MSTVISVEHLSKAYRLGQIGTGTLTYDLKLWWAKLRGKPNPLLRIGESDHGNRAGETLWALQDVSFTVEQGAVLGIIGRNGAGKSTLLKILSRVTAPSSGRIRVKGRVASLLEVGTGFHPELTGRENIYLNGAILGMSKAEITSKWDEIVDFAEVEKFIDTPVKRYSSGMYVRLAFAVAAHLEPEILVVDEVLAVGDAEFQRKCLGKMGDVAKQGRTVLFVSHNMDSIISLCPQCLVFNMGRLVKSANTADSVQHYLSTLSSQKTSIEPHVLFDSQDVLAEPKKKILRIEMLDESHNPKPAVYTWDPVLLRITYSSNEKIQRGTFILELLDYRHQRLIVLDSGVQVPIESGTHQVDCLIPRWPLSAGEYYLGGGMAISNREWLWREKNLGAIQVHGRDVFGLGRPPQLTRMFFAVEHYWQNPNNGHLINLEPSI